MRFANRLEFGDKTHEVSMTAQRLVQRMKKDSIHSGRRPSGLCGAALLLASRMHDFSRKPNDIVRVVKIHESTLRKRLLEFGETPSSALTIEEFMSIDLEAEQGRLRSSLLNEQQLIWIHLKLVYFPEPPSFKAARKKDKERLQKVRIRMFKILKFIQKKLNQSTLQLCDENEFTALQIEIEAALERDMRKSRKRKMGAAGTSVEDYDESTETDLFIGESTMDVIKECMDNESERIKREKEKEAESGLKPDLLALCTLSEKEQAMLSSIAKKSDVPDDLNLEGLDDDEIDGYILTEEEAVQKDRVWNQMNAEYLKLAKEREERAAKEREEGKPEKKKRRARKKPIGPSSTALDAIQKVLQEKKISTKINYDILKSLTTATDDNKGDTKPEPVDVKPVVIDESHLPLPSTSRKTFINLSNNRRSKKQQQQIEFTAKSSQVDEESHENVVAKDIGKNEQFFLNRYFISWFSSPIPTDDQTENEEADDIELQQEPEQDDSERLADLLNHGDEDAVYGEEPEEYY